MLIRNEETESLPHPGPLLTARTSLGEGANATPLGPFMALTTQPCAAVSRPPASAALHPALIMMIAVFARPPDSNRAVSARFRSASAAAITMRTARSLSLALVARTSTIRLLYAFPRRTIAAVV